VIPAAILIGGTGLLCWLRWGRRYRCRPCRIEFGSAAALLRHRRLAHHE
jgi:hypothetical protein